MTIYDQLHTSSLSSDTSQEMAMELSSACLYITALVAVCFIMNVNKEESVFANYGTVANRCSLLLTYL